MAASILPILALVGLCGAGIGLLAHRRLAGRLARLRSRQRLEQLFSQANAIQVVAQEVGARSPWHRLGLALAPTKAEELAKTRQRLLLAGLRRETDLGLYYLLKYGLVLLALVGGGLLWQAGTIKLTTMVVAAMVALFLPDLALKLRTSNRLQKVTLALPDFIDLGNVSMTAGLSWLISVKRVIAELREIHPEICREFTQVFDQIQTGMDRVEAFNQLAQRNPTKEMQYLVNVLIQNERMGSSILTSLSDFSQRIYVMRQQTMEEKAGKLSAKMALVIMPFLLLPYLLILVSEQMVNLMRMLAS
ncbi:MAG: type II secretion system F family protein [Thermodesulfobacteriota bacterium]